MRLNLASAGTATGKRGASLDRATTNGDRSRRVSSKSAGPDGVTTGCPEKIIVAFNKEDDDEVRLGRSKEVGAVGTRST